MKKLFIVLLLFFSFPFIIIAVGIVVVVIGKGTGLLVPKSPEIRAEEKEAVSSAEPGGEETARPVALSKPNIRYATEYYDVFGSSRDEIRANMEQKKKSTFLEGHDAATLSQTTVNFSTRQLADKCEAVLTQFDSSITYVYPRWTPLSNVSADLTDRWNAFMTTLKIHEEGHAKIEVDRINLFFKELKSFPESKNCQEFDRAWRAKADAFDAESLQLGAEYDRATNGGRTQGTIF